MSKSLSVVFFGTSQFAVPALRALAKCSNVHVLRVYTRADKVSGRGLKFKESPVKAAARELGLSVGQPERLKTPEFAEEIAGLDADLGVVAAYGKILPRSVFAAPRYGTINIHASLLPKYRGAAPIEWALMHGERETGVTTMLIDEGMDTGDIISSQSIAIEAEDDTGTLTEKLGALGAMLLLDDLRSLEDRLASRRPQQESEASYAPPITSEHCAVDWSMPAERICLQVRALRPRPGAFTLFRGQVLKLWDAIPKLQTGQRQVGEITDISAEGLLIQAGAGCVLANTVQYAGRLKMSAFDFANGMRLKPGEILGGVLGNEQREDGSGAET